MPATKFYPRDLKSKQTWKKNELSKSKDIENFRLFWLNLYLPYRDRMNVP